MAGRVRRRRVRLSRGLRSLLLQRGLRVLDHGDLHPDLVTSYLLKAADIIGVAPALDYCASCGKTDDLHRFSFAAGGVVCERCRAAGSYALRPGLTNYLAVVAEADLSQLPDPDEALSREAIAVTRRFSQYHPARRLRPLAVLDG